MSGLLRGAALRRHRWSGARLPRPATPQVAYLTNQLPWPPHSGGQIRDATFVERLGAEFDLGLVVVTDRYDRDVGNVASALPHCTSVVLAEADPGPLPADLPERVARYRHPGLAALVEDLVVRERLDMVHVEGYFLMQHVPDGLRVPVFLTEENVEFVLDRQREEAGEVAGCPWEVSRDLELAAWRRATRCGAVTTEEVDLIRSEVPGSDPFWLPPGCDHFGPPADEVEGNGAPTVVYVGNYSWTPSTDAAVHLLTDVWPLVRAGCPAARLVLAGAGDTSVLDRLLPSDGSVEVTGPLDSLRDVLLSAAVFLAPMRLGGGVKSKLLEAVHLGRAVVTTPVALQGLPPAVRSALVVARSPAELASATVGLLMSPDRHAEVTSRVRAVAGTLPTWAEATRRTANAWRACLADRNTPVEVA